MCVGVLGIPAGKYIETYNKDAPMNMVLTTFTTDYKVFTFWSMVHSSVGFRIMFTASLLVLVVLLLPFTASFSSANFQNEYKADQQVLVAPMVDVNDYLFFHC